MSVLRVMGWSLGLASLAGGALWLAETVNPPLADVASAETDLAPSAGAAPGLSAPVIADAPVDADLETRLNRLEALVHTLSQQLDAQQRSASRSREELTQWVRTLEQQRVAGSTVASDDAGANEEPPSPEAEPAAAEVRVALLDRQVRTERTDPRWSGPATAQIQAAFAEGGLAGSTLRNAACQTTLCRVEVDHRDALALDRFLGEFSARLGWNTHSYAQTLTHEDGSATLVLYLSREGYRLPRAGA